MISILILLPGVTFSQFRNTTWVMDKEKVKIAETDTLVEETENHLIYKSTVAEWPTDLIYRFYEGTLYQAEYHFDIYHNSKKLYLNDYESLKNKIEIIYGPPAFEDQYHWFNEQNKDNPALHPYAISLGHLKIVNLWHVSHMDITLSIKGEDGNVSITVIYKNPYLKKKENSGL